MQYIADIFIVSAVVSGVLALMAGVKNICREFLRSRMNLL